MKTLFSNLKGQRIRPAVICLVVLAVLLISALGMVRADDAATLVGGWRATESGPGGQRVTETILMANRTFSQTDTQHTVYGPYMLYLTGTYQVVEGTLRFQTTNWSPKEFMGSPVRVPPAWAVYYRIVDQDRLAVSLDGKAWTTAYRIR
jgi:hypothetical protein